jgi:hypothetical protein
MAINKVGSKGIADGSVATADLQDNVVTSAKLGDGEVTNAKLANTTVTLAGQSITLGASGTLANKFVDWQSIVVSDGSTVTTMVAGKGYFVNNTSAAGLVKLPISASIGDFVVIKDYAGNFGTNSLTIQRNGHNIQGVANDSLISTNRASLVLVYVDATKGWLYWEEHNVADLQLNQFTEATGGTVTESGDFKIHSFTGDGCFVVSQLGAGTGPSNVDYLVVAGGGGGGGQGGGGAGGYRTTFPSPGCNAGAFPISTQTYTITVGGGGTAGSSPPTNSRAPNGSDSVFSTITSTGGGGGQNAGGPGADGGSGGGAGYNGCNGSGNTPPVSPPQGNPGGTGHNTGFSTAKGGGGGGATVAGTSAAAPDSTGGPGGAGAPNTITGTDTSYAGGGGGGGDNRSGPSPTGKGGGSGGAGGGGNAATGTTSGPLINVQAGGTNTGGGGGAGGVNYATGAAGGKGIVIIRYKFQ